MDHPAEIVVGWKAAPPGNALSNFAPHAFIIDGVACACMEGFLQGLKIPDPDEQARVCGLPGPDANAIGQSWNWKASGLLHWRGSPIVRRSADYQALLDRAYTALFAQSEDFRLALAETGAARLVHPVGKTDPGDTVLTIDELCSRLEALRRRLPGSPAP